MIVKYIYSPIHICIIQHPPQHIRTQAISRAKQKKTTRRTQSKAKPRWIKQNRDVRIFTGQGCLHTNETRTYYSPIDAHRQATHANRETPKQIRNKVNIKCEYTFVYVVCNVYKYIFQCQFYILTLLPPSVLHTPTPKRKKTREKKRNTTKRQRETRDFYTPHENRRKLPATHL